MGQTKELGRRIELYSMDPDCRNISLALYRQTVDNQIGYLVHTYSRYEEAGDRVENVRLGLMQRAGLQRIPGSGHLLAFPCGARHEKALRRTFLDVCRSDGDQIVAALPLVRTDKKAEGELTVVPEGGGRYQVTAAADLAAGPRRCKAVARGFAKLCEMELGEEDEATVWFGCGQNHDALIGSMFFLAQNVRSAIKDEERALSQGVLAAPGSPGAGRTNDG